MKTPMQELFDELGKAEPTLMNLHSSDGRRFVEKYHDFLIKEEQEKIDFAVVFAEWIKNKGFYRTTNSGKFWCHNNTSLPKYGYYLSSEELLQLYITSTTNGKINQKLCGNQL